MAKVKSTKQKARLKERIAGYETAVNRLPATIPKSSLTKPGSNKK